MRLFKGGVELPRGGSKEGKVSRGRVEDISVVATHGEVWEDRSLGYTPWIYFQQMGNK